MESRLSFSCPAVTTVVLLTRERGRESHPIREMLMSFWGSASRWGVTDDEIGEGGGGHSDEDQEREKQTDVPMKFMGQMSLH